MRKLILIKHARPQVVEGLASDEWPLSAEGRAACASLAEAVRPHDPARIFTSAEPKAHETGQILAEALGRPVEVAAGLAEHDRSNVPLMPTREFISTMALFFKDRHRLVIGRETADQAADRIERAVQEILAANAQGNLALVTHGTVLALFAAAHGAGDAYQNWRRMGLPSLQVFSIPKLTLLETIDRIGPA